MGCALHIRLAFAVAGVAGFASENAMAADGDLDPTFGIGGVAVAGLTDATFQLPIVPVVQPDGKILICSTRASNGSSGSDFLVARFNANGTLDTSFSFDGKVTIDFDAGSGSDTCGAIALQADGKIVVAGTTTGTPTNNDFAVARLNADGTIDTSFGPGTGKTTVAFDLGGGNSDQAWALAIQADGKLVVAGISDTASNGDDFSVVRLLSDGTRDATFNLTGRVTIGFDLPGSTGKNDQADSIAIDDAGRILVSGVAESDAHGTSDYDFAVARLLPNGQLDPDFDGDGRATIAFNLGASGNDLSYRMLLQRDGKIVLSGYTDTSASTTSNYDIAVARMLPDGSPDPLFGIGGKTVVPFDLIPNGTDYGFGLAQQQDGKLLIGGGAQNSSSFASAALVRLDTNGGLDGQFGTLGKKLLDLDLPSPGIQLVTGLALQGTQIIATGFYTASTPSAADNFVVRLETDLIFADGFE